MLSIKAPGSSHYLVRRIKLALDIKMQVYWPGWWKLWPWWYVNPRDEDGPAELYFGFGPFQFYKYLWEEN